MMGAKSTMCVIHVGAVSKENGADLSSSYGEAGLYRLLVGCAFSQTRRALYLLGHGHHHPKPPCMQNYKTRSSNDGVQGMLVRVR